MEPASSVDMDSAPDDGHDGDDVAEHPDTQVAAPGLGKGRALIKRVIAHGAAPSTTLVPKPLKDGIAREALSLLEVLRAAAGDVGDTRLLVGADATIRGDRHYIQQAFHQLIDETRTLAPAGSPCIYAEAVEFSGFETDLGLPAGRYHAIAIFASTGEVNERRSWPPMLARDRVPTAVGTAVTSGIVEAHHGRLRALREGEGWCGGWVVFLPHERAPRTMPPPAKG